MTYYHDVDGVATSEMIIQSAEYGHKDRRSQLGTGRKTLCSPLHPWYTPGSKVEVTYCMRTPSHQTSKPYHDVDRVATSEMAF